MCLNQLKTIDILINYLLYKQDLKPQINSSFTDSSEFTKAKNELFNYLTIDTLLKCYQPNPNFSLEKFFSKGIIPQKYPEETKGPTIDLRFIDNYPQFYYEMVKALAEGNFVFTDNSTIIISSTNIETEVSEEWLFRLSQAYKNSTYQEICLINGRQKKPIRNEESLKQYLQTTKSFFVELSNNETSYSCESIVKNAENEFNQTDTKNTPRKVNNLIAYFKQLIPSEVDHTIEKYKIPDFNIIIKAIKSIPNFYKLPYKKQKQIIKIILLSYKNINIKNNEETQKFLLLLEKDNELTISKESIIPSLFGIYLTILMSLNLEHSNISLSSFKIKNFMSSTQQQNLKKLIELIAEIDAEEEINNNVKLKIEKLWQEIRNASSEDNDLIIKKNEELQQIMAFYKKNLEINTIRKNKRKTLQQAVQQEQENDLNDIAFDNDLIMHMLLKCVQRGNVYINPLDNNKLIIELYNEDIGKTTFHAEISLEKLSAFTSVNNYFLETTSYTFK